MAGEKIEKSVVDSFFDSFESVVDGIGKAYEGKTHSWKVEEVQDCYTGVDVSNGETYYEVSDGVRKFRAERKADADWLMERLEGLV